MKYALAAIIAVLALNVATPANAHSTLVRCDPSVGATSSAPPYQIRCWFSEDLDARKSTTSVSAAGQRVDKGDAHVDLKAHNVREMVVTLDTARLGDGAYNVSWQTLSAEDGELGEANSSLKYERPRSLRRYPAQ